MNLLKNFINITNRWKDSFHCLPTFKRAREIGIAVLCAPHPHVLTSIISVKNDLKQDWSSDYRFFSRSQWKEEDLFHPLIEESLPYFEKSPYIIAGMDDSVLKKTGRRIQSASFLRDPMSPAFHPNLIWGIRFIQISLTLPFYHFDAKKAPLGIPVRWTEACVLKKPKKSASPEEWEAFKQKKKKINLSLQFAREHKAFRAALNQLGIKKSLLITVDGAACTKLFLNNRERNQSDVVARCRSDIRLCFQVKHPKNKQHFYDPNPFTPEEVYKNEKIPWKTVEIFRAGKFRECQYKAVRNVYWQSVLKKERLTLFVLKRTPYYARKGHLNFREPAYLLCTNPNIESHIALQAYHDHSQIESNLKEEKSVIEIGKPQVRNNQSVHRQPAFFTAVYSALLLASLHSPHLICLPPWRGKVKRVGARTLIKELKKEVFLQFFAIDDYKPPPHLFELIFKMAC
jgi:hypothetical protein